MMNDQSKLGYYRLPTIADRHVVFVSEDDLWAVDLNDDLRTTGPARRLSANPGTPTFPALSPDGQWIAFTSRDEGLPEIYVMPAAGGTARRLTFLGANTRLVGWDPDKRDSALFISDAGKPFLGMYHLHRVDARTGKVTPINVGPAMNISFEPKGKGVVINRNGGGRGSGDPAMWKRYRGGKAGQLWIDKDGRGAFQPLIKLEADLACPMWIGNRIYFLSDHEGIGNLYSCTPTGRSLKRHTDHSEYYVRHPRTDGRRIVYACGAEVYIFDPSTDHSGKLEITTPSTFAHRNRKFADPSQYLETYEPHPQGHSLCIVDRGKVFSFANWEGHVNQRGETDCSERYRLASWLPDGETIAAIADGKGDEGVTLLKSDGSRSTIGGNFDFGRATSLAVSPVKPDRIAIANHRYELILVEASGNRRPKIVDRSDYHRIANLTWSPDARWLVYSIADSSDTRGLRIVNIQTGKKHDLTEFDFRDGASCFDPAGDYLYFLSYREYDPVYDSHFFDLGFPRGMRLLAIPLRADLPSPFEPKPRAPGAPPADANQSDKSATDKSKAKQPHRIKIDLKDIAQRIVAAPIPEGRYGQVRAIAGKILFSSFPIEGSLGNTWASSGPPDANGTIECWDLNEQKKETLVGGITNFDLSADGKTLVYRAGSRLRAIKAGAKPPSGGGGSNNNGPGRATGWIDLNRIKLSINPTNEWRQMFEEAWRLQRDHYWAEDMSGTDWKRVRERYLPLVERISCRSEFSDLMWELQGELGTSHAYEIGGDYLPTPPYRQGFLGADLEYDGSTKSWRFTSIPSGDSWDDKAGSPLNAPGVNIRKGDRLLAIDARKVNRDRSPFELLVNMAGQYVQLTIADSSGRNKRDVTIKALSNETPLRYRAWVEANRAYVHKQSRGRIGYVHIPDMGPNGYSQFHRYYLPELKCGSLIVDVRHNGGGHVSQIILEKLLRERIGYDINRWGRPSPYPDASVLGPIVAITNQNAGSDGDIFSHCFKLYKIGPLIGTRTWGGVVGIWPRHALVDGSITTQPEFSFWFKDVGFGVENYGTEPDIDVDILPQEYAKNKDPQLERAISEIQKLLKKQPAELPDFGKRPRLGLPKLPK